MKPRKIDEILRDLIRADAESKLDLSDCNPATRAGMETRKQAAQMEVKQLRAEYRNALRSGIAYLFVRNANDRQIREFTNVVLDEGTSIPVNVNDLYRRLAASMGRAMGERHDRVLGVTDVVNFIEAFRNLLEELDILVDYALITKVNPGSVVGLGAPTDDHILQAVREMIRSSLSEELAKVYIDWTALVEAEKQRYVQRVLPVVVFGCSDEEIENIRRYIDGNYIGIIDLNKESMSENTLIKHYKAIQAALNPNYKKRSSKSSAKKSDESQVKEDSSTKPEDNSNTQTNSATENPGAESNSETKNED